MQVEWLDLVLREKVSSPEVHMGLPIFVVVSLQAW